MDCFLKKIFESESGDLSKDNLVHLQFMKFSRGEFKDRAVLIYSKSKDKYSLSATYEYANEFVRLLAEKLGNNKTKISGVLVSTRDLTGHLNFSDKKQFAGVKQYVIDSEMSGNEIMEICDKFPHAFVGLSFSVDGTELKIKPKPPKSGKPSTRCSEEKIKADFCKLYTNDRKLIENFVFDSEILNNENVKKAEISHTYLIKDIELPKGETDPAKMREMAIKKGRIIRSIKIDDKVSKKEAGFEA
jgi:DNA-directed RNA polymerase subunit H (RpoH/RPB5)